MPDLIVIPQSPLSATVRLSASAAPSVVVPNNNLPSWIVTSLKNVDTPVTVSPPPTMLIPLCAVTTPTESTLVTSSYVTTPVKVAATPVRFLTVKSGVPSRAYAVVAKETEVPAPSVAIPVTFKFPLTAKSPPTGTDLFHFRGASVLDQGSLSLVGI